jgi:hypothetical protein
MFAHVPGWMFGEDAYEANMISKASGVLSLHTQKICSHVICIFRILGWISWTIYKPDNGIIYSAALKLKSSQFSIHNFIEGDRSNIDQQAFIPASRQRCGFATTPAMIITSHPSATPFAKLPFKTQ